MNMREAVEDRISNLPESLLHYILSFLHYMDGARTSALSKRWNYVWTTVPTLCFLKHYDSPTSSQTDKFMDFVEGTLNRHKLSNLDKFSLSWDDHLNDFHVHNWISSVVRGNVKQLSLNLCQRQPLFIPPSLFTCETLTSMELQTRPDIRFPKYISFPRLKRLKLSMFKIRDDSWNEELFTNSPVLEELIMNYCTVSTSSFCISVPTLKLLNITWSSMQDGLQKCVLKIHAPRLLTFSYTGYIVPKEFVLCSFPSLVEATIYINFQENIGAVILSPLLRALAHVKCLTVSTITLKAICSVPDMLNSSLTFLNVKMLTISNELRTDKGLIILLKAVPNLESLIFAMCMHDEIKEDSDGDDENDSDEDAESDSDEDDGDNYNDEDAEGDSDEDDSDNNEGDGVHYNDDYDANSVQGGNNQDNVDEVDECEDDYDSTDESWAPCIASTGCLFPHLKSVCFEEFAGNPREMRWVRLILRDAKDLQIMTICYGGEEIDGCYLKQRSEKEVMVEIPRFRRASPDCVIEFCSRD